MVAYNPVERVFEYNGQKYPEKELRFFYYYEDMEVYDRVFCPLGILNALDIGSINDQFIERYLNQEKINVEMSLSKYVGLKKANLL